MIQNLQQQIVTKSPPRIADAAALGVIVKFGARKLQLIRLIESIARPIVSFVERFRSSASEMSAEVKDILILEYWNLGDIVMISPFLQNLRAHYPNARITLVTNPKLAAAVASQNIVDETVFMRVPWAQHYARWKKYNPLSFLWFELYRTLKSLRGRHFDLAFAGRGDLRDNFMLWYVNANRRVGYAFGGGGFFLTDAAVPDIQNPHFSNLWLRLLEHLRIPIRELVPHLYLTNEDIQAAQKILREHGIQQDDFIVGVHPGARNVNRQWGQANFASVAERLREHFQVKTVWFQDPAGSLPMQPRKDFVPLSLPLREFMAVLSRCNILLCNDSGPMHVATGLNVPVVAVFGPGSPAWSAPLGPNNQVVIRDGFWCRPCSDYCLFDQPYCLRTIGVQEVYEAAARTLEQLLLNTSQILPRPLERIPT